MTVDEFISQHGESGAIFAPGDPLKAPDSATFAAAGYNVFSLRDKRGYILVIEWSPRPLTSVEKLLKEHGNVGRVEDTEARAELVQPLIDLGYEVVFRASKNVKVLTWIKA